MSSLEEGQLWGNTNRGHTSIYTHLRRLFCTRIKSQSTAALIPVLKHSKKSENDRSVPSELIVSPFNSGNAHDVETGEPLLTLVGLFAVHAPRAVIFALVPLLVALADFLDGEAVGRVLLVCEQEEWDVQDLGG